LITNKQNFRNLYSFPRLQS